VEILFEVSSSTTGSEKRKQSASEHDRGSYHRAPLPCGEAATDYCRCDKREAHSGYRHDVKQKSKTAGGNRHVDNALCQDYCEDDQDKGNDALEPGCAAEDQPPQNDA
jgi:hypothetical protein